MYIDSHCHLNDEAFDLDLDDVLKRCDELDRILLICLSKDDFYKALKIKEKNPKIDISIGIHPEDIDTYQDKLTLEELEDILINYPFIKAIGEIGLDYHYEKESALRQKELFIKQILLAKKYHKPISVHSRDAIKDTFDIMKEYKCDGVLHCFSGSTEMAEEFIKLGYYISFGGVLTFKNAKEIKEVAKIIPLDRMLIETDCPYLSPEPKRGKRNEPSYVRYTAEYLADLIKIDNDELADRLVKNYDQLFTINELRYNNYVKETKK